MKEKELSNREKLRLKKPAVLDKILVHEHEQIPRIQLQWRTQRGSCNFNCMHCSVHNVGNNSEPITYEDVRRVYKEADEIGISRTTISGGEPLTFDLDKLVEAINPSSYYIQLDTNAWLFNEEKAKHLKEIGIDCIAPSLDSLNLIEHDKFRNKPGSAAKVLKAFDIIQKYDFATYVQTVVDKNRLYSNEFIEFLKYFNNREIGVFVSFIKPVGSFSNHFEELINKDDLKYIERLEELYNCFSHLTPNYNLNKKRKCVAGKNIFGITQSGDVIQCIYHYMSIGNIKEESLKDIYERMQRINIYDQDTCLMADGSNEFIKKYVVPLYGKELPISYKELLTNKDFN